MRTLPFPLLLALRLLRSTRRDAFASFLSAVAAGGIALGVAALTLALSALSGFQAALRGEVLARTPPLEVTLPADTTAEARSHLAAAIAALPGVTGVQASASGRGWLLAGSRVQAVELVGYEDELPAFFPAATDRAPGLYLPDGLARGWGLELGTELELVSPRSTLGPLGPQPRSRRLPLVGTFATGRTDREYRVALPLGAALSLLGEGELRLVIATVDLGRALALAPSVRALLPPKASLRTWEDLNRPLFFALRLEKSITFLAVSLITVVAALALVGGLALVIANKRAELGMLGAMGATPTALRAAFLLFGGLLSGSGALAGGLLGATTAWVLDRWALVPLPGAAYFLDHVPFVIRPLDVAAVAMVTVVLALGCSAYGAGRAAGLEPVEALRR